MKKFDLKNLEQFEEFIGESKKVIQLINTKGDVAELELETLESKHLGKILYLQNNMPRPKVLNPHEVKAGRKPIFESDESFQNRLLALKEEDYEIYSKLFETLTLWIKQSYPEIPDAPLRKLIMNNISLFIEEFMSLHNNIEDSDEKKELKDFIKSKQQHETHAEATEQKQA